MNKLMLLQLVNCGELFVTLLTLMWFRTDVNESMTLKVDSPAENFITDVTYIMTLHCMRLLVFV